MTELALVDNSNDDKTCGRPLGMAFDTIENGLIVVHSSQGVFQVNLGTGEKKLLVSATDVIGDEVR